MENFKRLEDILVPDNRHALLGELTGVPYQLEDIHNEVSLEELSNDVPEVIRNQFNILKNLILYSWYSYPLATIADLKAYVLIEHALKILYVDENLRFGQRIQKAIDSNLLCDKGFRHIRPSLDPQEYCKKLPKVLPHIRNELAHGSSQLDFRCIDTLKICADFINQLYK